MSNWTYGPQSAAEASKMAQQSQTTYSPGNGPNTDQWNADARQNYLRAGGK